VQAKQNQAGVPNIVEGIKSQECLSVQLIATEYPQVVVVAEQAKHADELADPNHEDGCVGGPEPRRQHRDAVVHWAEDVVQRPCDNDIECDRQEQAQDTEPEQAIGRHDVRGGLCCIPLGHQASQRNKVAEACEC